MLDALQIIAAASLGLALLLWLLMALGALKGLGDRRFFLAPEAGEEALADAALPSLTVMIPARNEAGVIGEAVRSALAQDYPDLELIVIDDSSTDGTGQEALEAAGGDRRFRLMTGQPLAEGWKGKPWALWQAQQEARGEVLLFVDADVRLHPRAARRTVEALIARRLDVLSVWGTWIMEGFWVNVALPVVGGFVRGAHPLDRINDPEAPGAFANGQFILMPRPAYDRMDGHRAVADEVLEDVRLAEAAVAGGLRAGMFLGPEIFRVRLYTSLPALWSGTVKNFYAGMGRKAAVAVMAAGFVGFTALWPPLALVLGLLWRDVTVVALASATLAAMVGFRLIQDRSIGASPLFAVTHPVGALILFGVIVTSALRGLRGKATSWKGRPV